MARSFTAELGDESRVRQASIKDMSAKNLEDQDAAPVQDWASITEVLDGGLP